MGRRSWGDLPLEMVKEARSEEVGFMEQRNIWEVRPVEECWEKTGKRPSVSSVGGYEQRDRGGTECEVQIGGEGFQGKG